MLVDVEVVVFSLFKVTGLGIVLGVMVIFGVRIGSTFVWVMSSFSLLFLALKVKVLVLEVFSSAVKFLFSVPTLTLTVLSLLIPPLIEEVLFETSTLSKESFFVSVLIPAKRLEEFLVLVATMAAVLVLILASTSKL